VVADQRSTALVRYQGDLPDLFREGQGIVASGAFDESGTFVAKQVLAKHDERYMPREVSKALKEQGEWRGDGAKPAGNMAHRPTARRPSHDRRIGAFALVLALVLSLAQPILSAVGGARRSSLLAGAGRGAAVAPSWHVPCLRLALIHAFVVSDFSVANVAANSHTAKPLLYKVAGAWGSHEGSMLLWCLVLTGYGAAVASFGEACRRACGPTPWRRKARWACCSWPTPSSPPTRWPGCSTFRSRALAQSAAAGPGLGLPPAVPLLRLCRLLGGVLVLRWPP
jgi:hypothetical protein